VRIFYNTFQRGACDTNDAACNGDNIKANGDSWDRLWLIQHSRHPSSGGLSDQCIREWAEPAALYDHRATWRPAGRASSRCPKADITTRAQC
jgi:hypothetical protein